MLKAHAVTLERGGKKLFSDLSLEISAGQLLRISGKNGSGKSSLLRLLCGLLRPTAGQVSWNECPIDKDREALHARLIYLGHTAALKGDHSAIENLMAIEAFTGHHITAQNAQQALSQAGLGGLARRMVRTLSQGQKQRVALARLWLDQMRPLWLLDEPFNALDQEANENLQRQIRMHLARGGMVALSSHQALDLDQMPDTRHLAL
jgi:heme exporter protein A